MGQEDNRMFQIPLIIVKLAFWLLFFFWLLFCVVHFLSSSEDVRLTDYDCQDFNEGWLLNGDTNRPVIVPGRLSGTDTQVRIQNVLPEDITDRTTIMVKGQHQNVTVRIDGEVRGELDNQETRLFGFHMFSGYLMIPLSNTDAGKCIEIQYSAPEPDTAGRLNDVRIGTEKGILFWMLDSYGSDLIFAILLFYTGIILILFGVMLHLGFHGNPKTDITYLGMAAVCTAVWILGESRLRQFYYGSLSVGELMLWSALFLIPIPMLFYINRLQKNRHIRIYTVGTAVAVAVNIIMTVLVLTNTYDYYEMYPIGWGVILGSGFLVVFTVIWDYVKGIRQWKLLAGILLLVFSAILQMWSFLNSSTGIYSNNFISLGLMLFMIIMGISDVSGLLKQSQERILATKANETKTDFLANMSHEIRTPINAMLGFDELILREEENEQVLEYAANIKKAGESLLILISDILDFSKVESGKMEIINEEYETAHMLRDVINMVSLKAQGKGLSFEIVTGKDIPRLLYGDEMRVKQIITNILNNAVKYTENGKVTLTVNFDQVGEGMGRLRISVEDTGIGIRPEDIARITEAFQRFDIKKNRNIEGVGLGMAIVADLLNQMGGRMQVYSTYGKGSDFRLLIPQEIRDATPMEAQFQKSTRIQGKRKTYQALFIAPRARVLFVDDNDMNLSVIRGLLKETRIQIDTAESGVKCLELTRQKQYHLIFMDHLMPEMDGLETLNRLRREDGNPNQQTRVVALTANAVKGVRDFYLEKGFCEYVTKPIEGERLEQLLYELLPPEYILISQDAAPLENEKAAAEEIEMAGTKEMNACMLELIKMLEQSHISLAKGYHYAADSMQQFHWMLKLFADSFAEKFQKILSFYEDKDIQNYMIEVHSLKSNAKTVGAEELYGLALEHEQNAREGNWEYIQTHWEELCEEWLWVINGIRTYLGEEETVELPAIAATEQEEDMLTSEQRMLLDNSLAFIERYESEPAAALLENLMKEPIPESLRFVLQQALERLEEFDYLGAEELLGEI